MTSRHRWLIRGASFVFIMGLWQLMGTRINPLFFSYPSAIVQQGWMMVLSGELAHGLLQSLQALSAGMAIGVVLGVILGLILGRYQVASEATEWLINALYATPLIALIPLIIMWFGLGFQAKLFIVATLTLFPVLINTYAGVRDVDQGLLDVGTAFVASESQLFTKIILPSAVPFIMTGLRLAVGRALIGVVAAEFFTGITGLGAMVVRYGNQFDTAAMLVPVLVLMALGVFLTGIVRSAEDHFALWRTEG